MMIETEKVTTLKAKHQSKSSTSLSWFERIGYGFGDMSYNIIFQFVNAYLLFYYTDVGGIQPAVIATLFLVVRVLDAIFDPIMGLILDKTNTRWGKARPYLLWVAFPFALLRSYVSRRLISVRRGIWYMRTSPIFYWGCPLVCKRSR